MERSETQGERERLRALYGEMSDGELLELEGEAGDLTEVAREALAGETSRRGLIVAASDEVDAVPEVGSFGEGASSGWKTLHVFAQTFEAQAVFRLLEREGIEFRVEDRTVNADGTQRAGPAVQLALLVESADWDRSVLLLRREAGLFPEAVVDPHAGEEEEDTEAGMTTVGEFEDVADVRAAADVLTDAGVWFREVTHPNEDWQRTSIEVKAEDGDRALEALERLLDGDASSL